MTLDQAVAILQAERVLQEVGERGPDIEDGSAWRAYIKEAGKMIKGDPLSHNEFNDLHLLRECDGCEAGSCEQEYSDSCGCGG